MEGCARRIVELRVGAHLYGTDTPASDLDEKRVVLPSGLDILLQRAGRNNGQRRSQPENTRKQAGEEDSESFGLQRFVELLAAGQPLAIEMLFAPDAFLLSQPDPLWRDIQAIGPSLLTRRAAIFARYAKRQAGQFGIKGDRANAARQTLEVLTRAAASLGGRARLQDIAQLLDELARASPHIRQEEIELQSGRTMRHLDVCGRKAAYTITIAEARDMVARLSEGYGQRALAAAGAGGIDWKALSHAVRIGREAIELLTTGRLAFPLGYAPHLLAIKLGQLPYAEVAGEIEALLDGVTEAAAASVLPESSEAGPATALVLRAHAGQVVAAGFAA